MRPPFRRGEWLVASVALARGCEARAIDGGVERGGEADDVAVGECGVERDRLAHVVVAHEAALRVERHAQHGRGVGKRRAARQVEDAPSFGEDEDARAEQLGAHHLRVRVGARVGARVGD